MNIGQAINVGVGAVAKDWTTYRKKELRDQRRGARARAELLRGRVRERSLKEIARTVIEQAYLKASADGTLPASARQIFYQARPLVAAETEKPLDDVYFTQQLLPDYLQETGVGWAVVFDARGHLWEPHTETEIQLGTLAVREYLLAMHADLPDRTDPPFEPYDARTFPTHGPANRYRHVLFIEKEGFMPLFQRARLAERFDLAIMSTKGMSSTAARTLMERLDGVRFLVLHDFDKAGFSIAGTLQRDTRRYTFTRRPDVVDLGLRLADVEAEGLLAEPVRYRACSPESEFNLRGNLEKNGATGKEINVLVTPGWNGQRGQRVELNAFPSDQFLRWIERKLTEHGVTKFVPETKTLEAAYRRVVYIGAINEALEKAHEDARDTADQARVPATLARQVQRLQRTDPELSWDATVARLAGTKAEKRR